MHEVIFLLLTKLKGSTKHYIPVFVDVVKTAGHAQYA